MIWSSKIGFGWNIIAEREKTETDQGIHHQWRRLMRIVNKEVGILDPD